jgi:hypothetical protein
MNATGPAAYGADFHKDIGGGAAGIMAGKKDMDIRRGNVPAVAAFFPGWIDDEIVKAFQA